MTDQLHHPRRPAHPGQPGRATQAMPNRRRLMLAATGALLGAAGCGTTSPPPRLFQLRSEPPPGAAAAPGTAAAAPRAPASPAAGTTVGAWELSPDVRLPAYLDRDALVLLRGNAGLQLLEGQRWAEPLSDAVPRVLHADLARLRGGSASVWLAPAPAGVPIAARLRVDIGALQASAERGAVLLQARWTLAAAGAAPQAFDADIEVPLASTADGDAIAAGHRLALWRLAERIAGPA